MEIITVTSENINVLLNLAQAYEAEFSVITKKNPNSDGLYPLDTNWDENHPSYLLFDNDTPIGFCMKTTMDGRHDISEFYMIPTRRREGIAKHFAIQIFKIYKGEWQVRQIQGADNATKFWRSAIKEFTNNNFVETQDVDMYWGKVTKQAFRS